MMKKIIFLILLLIVMAGIFITYQKPIEANFNAIYYQSACSKPLAVRIGNVDPKYNLTQTQVLADINQAMQIWNKGYGQTLLVYDPNATLPINFVYDDRQSLIDQTNSSVNQVTDLSNNLKQKDADLAQQKKTLDAQYQQIQQDTNSFNQSYATFKQSVDFWNTNGGITSDQLQQLQDQQAQLKAQADSLNARVQQYQQAAKDYNAQIDPYNQQVQQLQSDGQNLQQVNQNLNTALTQNPEEGLYTSAPDMKKIDIFFIDNQNKLIETLAHEMGHALGLEHNQNPKSIMYPYIQGSLIPSSNDLSDLAAICKPKSVPEIFYEKLQMVTSYYTQTLESYFVKS